MNRKGLSMKSLSQIEMALKEVFEKDADELATTTGFIKRKRAFRGSQFAKTLVFGWLNKPALRTEELTQIGQIAGIQISSPGLCKRFTPEAATFLFALLQRLTAKHLQAEAVDSALLRRFSAVIIEDSSSVTLPTELSEVWRGCGGSETGSQAGVKLHVRWDLLRGQIWGPCLTDARCPDTRSPFKEHPLPANSLYVADLGYFHVDWLQQMSRREPDGSKRYFLSRFNTQTGLWTRSGHRLELRGLLPQHEGQVVERGVLLGKQARLPVRLIMIRVPADVAALRRERLEEKAKEKGEKVAELAWTLADWTILICNVPRKRLAVVEVLVLLRLRWQIEWLFKRWKTYGLIDEWRSHNPWRILCELYSKLMAQLLVHWVQVAGCWYDPHRSLVKAMHVVQRAGERLLAALCGEAKVRRVLSSMCRSMKSGCRLNTRATFPNTSQLLSQGLTWELISP
jgi:hypothetical protein